jgi:kinesin family protein 18/19
VFRNNRNREKQYSFDYVYDQNSTSVMPNSQHLNIIKLDIYNTTAKKFIADLTEGYNFSVFAYGATGAGKTYTMMGNEANPGIMKNSIEDLFTN